MAVGKNEHSRANSMIFVDFQVCTNFGVSNRKLGLDFLLPILLIKCAIYLRPRVDLGVLLLLFVVGGGGCWCCCYCCRGERERERQRREIERERERDRKEREREGEKREEDKSAGIRCC